MTKKIKFTADTVSMSPNVSTEERFNFFKLALDNLTLKVNPDWPRKEIITEILLYNFF